MEVLWEYYVSLCSAACSFSTLSCCCWAITLQKSCFIPLRYPVDALLGSSNFSPEQAVYFFSWFYFQAPRHAASSHSEHKAFLQENDIKLILLSWFAILCYFYLWLRKHDVSWKSKYILKGQTHLKCEMQFKAPKYRYEWLLSLKVNTDNKAYR